MAEMVASAITQEAVGGAVSYLSSNREKKASERHYIERLEVAHMELGFAVEISSKMPIRDVSLLCRSMTFKRNFEECGEVLERCKLRVLEADEEQRVTSSSSFPKRFARVVKSYVSDFFGMNKDDLLSCSRVQRFEWYGVKAREFARDVETGCTLAHYNFFSPLIKPLFEEKKPLYYEMLQESQILHITIVPKPLEGRGIEAWIRLIKEDIRMPLKSFELYMIVRLSEHMDIIGIIIKCLQSLGPRFESLAQDVGCQLIAIQSSQDALCSLFTRPLLQEMDPLQASSEAVQDSIIWFVHCLITDMGRPDPLCCRTNGHMPFSSNIISTKSVFNIPEPVIHVHCKRYISVAEYNYTSNATHEGDGNDLVREYPILELHFDIKPHSVHHEDHQGSYEQTRGNSKHTNAPLKQKRINASLCEMQEMIMPNAIRHFIRQPEIVEYSLHSRAAHGNASFYVLKSSIQLKSSPPMENMAAFYRAAALLCTATSTFDLFSAVAHRPEEETSDPPLVNQVIEEMKQLEQTRDHIRSLIA